MTSHKTHSGPSESSPTIRLASRASQLALAQAEEVAAQLDDAEIITFSTRGDEILDRPLAEIGGKGLFVKTLERAMLTGEADAAVHSGKDMETQYAAGTTIAAFLKRADRRDALIGDYSCFDDLPENALSAPRQCGGQRSSNPSALMSPPNYCAAMSTAVWRNLKPGIMMPLFWPWQVCNGWVLRIAFIRSPKT